MAGASADCPAEPLDSEHPLFILYTSGITGKPKGVLHTTGGYLLGVSLTHKWVFDIKEDDVYWCTADVGWVTGHSYIVYGPLCQRQRPSSCTRARPNHPQGRPLLGDHRKVQGDDLLHRADGDPRVHQVGRPAPEGPRPLVAAAARQRRRADQPGGVDVVPRVIGGGRCPIVDTWWQTETGAIMISPLPGAIPTKPGSATKPLPGIDAEVVDKQGQPVPANAGRLPGHQAAVAEHDADDLRRRRALQGNLLEPGDPGVYFTADGARQDEDGYIWVMGRVDDVLNVSGHRLSTMEVESALVHHPKVAEAAVVGRPDDLKGEAIVLLRHAEAGRRAGGRAEEGTADARRQGYRRAGPAGRHPVHRRPAQDAKRQDHAPASSATSPPAGEAPATRRRWKTSTCWPSCARMRSEAGVLRWR